MENIISLKCHWHLMQKNSTTSLKNKGSMLKYIPRPNEMSVMFLTVSLVARYSLIVLLLRHFAEEQKFFTNLSHVTGHLHIIVLHMHECL